MQRGGHVVATGRGGRTQRSGDDVLRISVHSRSVTRIAERHGKDRYRHHDDCDDEPNNQPATPPPPWHLIERKRDVVV